MKDARTYYSTRQTAGILGLSVGTVQRMVTSGTLQAYTTQGGHRRILASSVRHYCRARGVPSHGLLSPAAGVCILHDASLSAPMREAFAQMEHVSLISHPLELTGLNEQCAAFFIDARLGWLDGSGLHRPPGLSPQARFIVYNSPYLPAEQRSALAQQAQLHPGDLSTDLVTGFLMGMRSGAEDAPVGRPTH